MAFNELPNVDDNSKNSERSETKFKEFFSQHNNFISRTDVPDKGCDFDVEIIKNGTQSSNWRFPVQLKSIQNPQFVEGNKFISYPFETSRLNYLMQRPVSMGVLVLYLIDEDKCYFDYAEKIYERLMVDRGSDEWKQSEKVNVRIPVENMISDKSVRDIHEVFVQRFERSQEMQASHGKKYGLPTTNLSGEFKYDYTNTEHVKKFMLEYGAVLLNNYDLSLLFNMLTRMPIDELTSSKELLLIAAIVYSEAGKYSESIFFQTKLKKNFNLSPGETLSLSFCALKTNLLLGYITQDDFTAELEILSSGDIAPHNKITIRINLVRYKLIDLKVFSDYPALLDKEITDIFEEIEKLDASDKHKDLFIIWNSENYAILLNRKLSSDFAGYNIEKDLGGDWPLDKKRNRILSFLKNETDLLNTLNNLFKKGLSVDDKLLQANALSTYVTYYIQKQITLLSYSQELKKNTADEEHVKKIFSYALNAYNLFVELNMLKDAHYSISNCLELLELARYFFDADVIADQQTLGSMKKQLERDLDIQPYDLVISAFLITLKNNTDTQRVAGSDMPNFTKMDDEQLQNLAGLVLSAKGLPKDRLINVFEEMKAYRLFQQRCHDKNIVVLQVTDVPRTPENTYARPIVFVLRSAVTGIETAKNINMDILLSSWGF